jgi:hypothetical protein
MTGIGGLVGLQAYKLDVLTLSGAKACQQDKAQQK